MDEDLMKMINKFMDAWCDDPPVEAAMRDELLEIVFKAIAMGFDVGVGEP